MLVTHYANDNFYYLLLIMCYHSWFLGGLQFLLEVLLALSLPL